MTGDTHMREHVSMAIICLALKTAATATAGTIYKCTEGGRTSYHDRPCGRGAVALKVQAAPAPSPDALERLARERALLQEIEDARADQDKREAQERRAHDRARRSAEAQRRRCDRLRLQRKWADEDSARADRDESERARTKARRQAEALAVECPA
jgi:hypothetical protein